jgi:hypothetical protein
MVGPVSVIEFTEYTGCVTRTTGSASVWHRVPYALLELETGNFVGFYETERAALEDVVDSIERYGATSVATLALAYSTPGDVRPIAKGPALAEHARAAVRRQTRSHNGTAIPITTTARATA